MSNKRRGVQTAERLQELRRLRLSAQAKLDQDTRLRLLRKRLERKR